MRLKLAVYVGKLPGQARSGANIGWGKSNRFVETRVPVPIQAQCKPLGQPHLT